MDVFSHGLWSAVGAAAVNKSSPRRISLTRAAGWGVFPDLFAFGPFFLYLFYRRLVGAAFPLELPTVEPVPQYLPLYQISHTLYQWSHSIIIFALAFGLAVLISRLIHPAHDWNKRIPWSMLAWGVHILVDIPTHSYRFYPTPFLWPLSGWKFNGFSWGTPWFIVVNYGALLLTIWWLRQKKKKL